MKKTMNRAFTLIEIMIVVLIIGILLAIAVPNFVRAREASRAKACVANLKQIDSAKEQWAMDNRATTGASIAVATLVGTGTTGYIKTDPKCPSSGTYDPQVIGTNPSCSVGGAATDALAHTLP
jgi:prepilin-type N-terminal cleavage/methylation domain-containing protein